jgi:hypothetical protein
MWASWRGTKYTIRRKVVASPKFGPWWVLWVQVCMWLVLAPKVFQLCTNHLVLVLCRFVWVIDACHSSWSHPGAPARPSSPQSVTSQGACHDSLLSIVFSLDSHLNPLRSLGVRHTIKWAIICAIVAIVAQNKWRMKHLEIKKTFLNGDLKEEVYMFKR